MNDFVDTYPVTPHRFDADSVQRFRQHEGSVDDEHDAARDYEAEHGRHDEGAGAVLIPVLIALIGVACIGIWSRFGDALLALAHHLIPAATGR